jgi:hypothetical protein
MNDTLDPPDIDMWMELVEEETAVFARDPHQVRYSPRVVRQELCYVVHLVFDHGPQGVGGQVFGYLQTSEKII